MEIGTRPAAVFMVRRTVTYSAAITAQSAAITKSPTYTCRKWNRASQATFSAQLTTNSKATKPKRLTRFGASRVYCTSHTMSAT